jgi:hypothetical protein
MKRIILYLILSLIIISCSKTEQAKDFYILSAQDSLRDNGQLPPSPPPPPGLKYYSNIVFIFDSANRVYLYQTEIHDKNNNTLNESLGKTWCCKEENYPFFINLEPDDLMTLDAKYFIDFIRDNDTFFRLDTNFRKTNRFIFFVSDFDTIKNIGFYNLIDYIHTDKHTIGRVFYKVRKATEEERNILRCKRSGKNYDPKQYQWSESFLDGNTKPFTLRYDSLENSLPMRIKKKVIFKVNSLELGRLE